MLVHTGCLWWDACASNNTWGHFFPCSAHAICPYPPSHCLPHEGRTLVHSVSEFLCWWRSSVGHCEDGVSSGSGLLLKLHSDPAWMGLESSSQGKLTAHSASPLCFCSCCGASAVWWSFFQHGYAGYHRVAEVQESSPVTPGPFARWDVAFKLLFENPCGRMFGFLWCVAVGWYTDFKI